MGWWGICKWEYDALCGTVCHRRRGVEEWRKGGGC